MLQPTVKPWPHYEKVSVLTDKSVRINVLQNAERSGVVWHSDRRLDLMWLAFSASSKNSTKNAYTQTKKSTKKRNAEFRKEEQHKTALNLMISLPCHFRWIREGKIWKRLLSDLGHQRWYIWPRYLSVIFMTMVIFVTMVIKVPNQHCGHFRDLGHKNDHGGHKRSWPLWGVRMSIWSMITKFGSIWSSRLVSSTISRGRGSILWSKSRKIFTTFVVIKLTTVVSGGHDF